MGRWVMLEIAMPREISEEAEDERVGLVRCFQRDEMRGAGDLGVTGVR